jgi:speckle-type POZ protein
MAPQPRRDTTNEYAALFVALIGEGPNPQGVVATNEGKVVRAFHRFTLVDQTGQGRDLTKGRTREAGAVKISCARQDPNARNCHGYRKFVKRNILEDPARGYLQNDTIIIKYTIELVVSTGGALSRNVNINKGDLIKAPLPTLGRDLGELFRTGQNSDYTIVVQSDDGQEEIPVHRMLLEARSPFFRGMLESNMAEAQEGRYVVRDIDANVFKALLHFIYTDVLPEEFEGTNLEVNMAQHLLAAADMYQLTRLRQMCERRLCETVDVETVATTLALAEQNHAEDLKRVCLDYVSKHLSTVMQTEGYRHMARSCPNLQAELLQVIANTPGTGAAHARDAHSHQRHAQHGRRLEDPAADERRVRPRRME